LTLVVSNHQKASRYFLSKSKSDQIFPLFISFNGVLRGQILRRVRYFYTFLIENFRDLSRSF